MSVSQTVASLLLLMIDRCVQAPGESEAHVSGGSTWHLPFYILIKGFWLFKHVKMLLSHRFRLRFFWLSARFCECVRKIGGCGRKTDLGCFQFLLTHNPHRTVVGWHRFEN